MLGCPGAVLASLFSIVRRGETHLDDTGKGKLHLEDGKGRGIARKHNEIRNREMADLSNLCQ